MAADSTGQRIDPQETLTYFVFDRVSFHYECFPVETDSQIPVIHLDAGPWIIQLHQPRSNGSGSMA